MTVRSRLASVGDVEAAARARTRRGRPSRRAGSPADLRRTLAPSDPLVMGERGRGGQPAAVRPMTSWTISIRGPELCSAMMLRAKVGALLGRGPGAERLADRDDVVVDGLGQADHGQLVVVARAGRRRGRRRWCWCRRRRWCAGRRRRRAVSRSAAACSGSCPRCDEAALARRSATLVSLTRRVADGAAAERVQPARRRPDLAA